MVAYSFATDTDVPLITSVINTYRKREAELDQQSQLQSAALEMAAQDRNLFVTTPQDTGGPDLRYPEYARNHSGQSVHFVR